MKEWMNMILSQCVCLILDICVRGTSNTKKYVLADFPIIFPNLILSEKMSLFFFSMCWFSSLERNPSCENLELRQDHSEHRYKSHLYLYKTVTLISSKFVLQSMPSSHNEADDVHLKALKLHQTNKCTEKLITYTTSHCINSNTRRDIQRRYIHVGNNSGVFAEHADLWLYACLRGKSDWSLLNVSLVSSHHQVTQI